MTTPMNAATHSAPISSHPAFKWGVGAWFALLLGLGLFVMPAAVHLLMAERLGLADMLADPGMRRLVLSAVAAVLGLLIGLAIAMRVTAVNEAMGDDDDADHADEPGGVWLHDDGAQDAPPLRKTGPRRLFNPREDMAEEGIRPVEDPPEEADNEELLLADAPQPDNALMQLWHEEADSDTAPEWPTEPEAADANEMEISVFDKFKAETAPAPIADNWEEPVAAFGEDSWDEWQNVGPKVADVDPIADPNGELDNLDESNFDESEEEGFDEPAPTAPPAPPAPAEEAPAPEPAPSPAPAAALGDLPLDKLTERLGNALKAFQAGPSAEEQEDSDMVIAFLRREAERDAPESHSGETSDDAQAELRSALDKLSRVGKPD
ncbi:hypothetical protein N6L26_11655 [Qipengyuania sp. SS22]|uniref:hypothetical protein n=1 Tax=Qipengyuania sp. SS22 TaxID=2979461 RepID=UPI0021E52DD9|nr:hypothetical protein [Qipengyuania sp. SS22]UYH54685.1 hypothetical protein N6L26_11655 [Qipengyuania sp. SS22]